MGCTIHVTLHETTWDVNTMFMIYMPIVILLIKLLPARNVFVLVQTLQLTAVYTAIYQSEYVGVHHFKSLC